METVCTRGDVGCEVRALTAALHSLHLYCAVLATALITCCAPRPPSWYGKQAYWRGQNTRGVASLALGVVWCVGAAAALLRPGARVELAAALLAPLAWLAAAWLHVALWARHAASPLLYLAVYWLLVGASATAALWHDVARLPANAVDIYVQALAVLLALMMAVVDCICFYDEVTKGYHNRKTTREIDHSVVYEHANVHFYSKISFFWLNSLLYKGYKSPLENDDLGELPDGERSTAHYKKFKRIYKEQVKTKDQEKKRPSLWFCYLRMVWPNFYLAGFLKLLSDLLGVVPPLGLAVVISYIEEPVKLYNAKDPVTFYEFLNNGYVMMFLMTLSLVAQAFLSQNSTHLVSVEGIRLKTALQGMIYDKCMRIAPWASSMSYVDEESPLLHNARSSRPGHPGLLTNLVSQDTYNIMSCVWICHYTWAIPLKVSVILYLLYTKLGLSAIIGSAISILFITPMQFYLGKKISENSRDIAKCSDHRITKMTEILQGIDVIKLYVWEDLFKEKILNLREVELKLLNKDSIHWNFLTFSTQVSTILVTVVTFTTYSFLNNSDGLTAVNVFAGVALFNQLTVPLLILPVTVLMIIQAMVSSKRIKDFLNLPESNNNQEDEFVDTTKNRDKFNDAFIHSTPQDTDTFTDRCKDDNNSTNNLEVDHFSDDEIPSPSTDTTLLKFQNAVFSWGMRSDSSPLEIDDLEIPAGKLVMVVGPTGSGKSSLLSAVLGEMYLEKGDVVTWNGKRSVCYSGQPPWLLEGSVRDNIVMDGPWCQRRYTRVLRATGLRPDLELMPEGDSTVLGSRGNPLSGGQRVRVGVARALYSRARLVALDEPLGALDASLARHVVARALVPAVRTGRTVLLATNRLELMHYADLIIVMEDGRVSSYGRAGGKGALARWARLAAEARAAAAQGGAGPSGGAARERCRLVRALSRAHFQGPADELSPGMSEVTGAHLLPEMAVCGGGSWRGASVRRRPLLARQLSSPPASLQPAKCRQDVRRVMSADASNTTLRREPSLMRRLLRPRPHRTLSRWTPRSIRRLITSDTEPATEDTKINDGGEDSMVDTSITSNGVETIPIATVQPSTDHDDDQEVTSECTLWWEYACACGWWAGVYWVAAAGAQALAVAADCWLAHTTAENARRPLTEQQMWGSVSVYAAWSACGLAAGGGAAAAGAAAGARARRVLHERLLHAALHAPLHHHRAAPLGDALHRFSADVQLIDQKLPTAVGRWAQLALLCGAAVLVNAAAAPWSLLAVVPSVVMYLVLQTVYLRNSRELQHAEARSAAPIVSLARETSAGGATIRAACLQPGLRARMHRRLDHNHNALLLLNAANRWLGLALDLVGAAAVCVWSGLALCGGAGGARAGLAGAHSLLLPAYLAHLAKCRADLDQQLAAVQRVRRDTLAPQEDYRDHCPIPTDWQRRGKIDFEDVSVQHEPGAAPTVAHVTLSVPPGEKVAVCGRSGSGKSSLLMSCVGAATVSRGRIVVDGVDASQVPLRVLRHRLVVLPQEATLFSGTLRENLDPLCVHTDQEIWHSLRAVGLYDFVAAQAQGLECIVGRGHGCAWSAGRSARACAARVVLRAPLAVALLLDEPAAALDANSERSLLAAVAQAAPNTTIITVAHRISSVRDYERAVVVERGRVVEQDSPSALLAQPRSRLARLSAAPTA